MSKQVFEIKDSIEFPPASSPGLKSGQGEAQSRQFNMYVGKSGRAWFIADQPNKADNVYVTAFKDWKRVGDGFGGAELKLKVVNWAENNLSSDIFLLKGGWHGNSEAFLGDTGIDINDTHLTFGVVSIERESIERKSGHYFNYLHKSVLYYDERPTLGTFKRVEDIARRLAYKLGKDLFFSVESQGGGSYGGISLENDKKWGIEVRFI